MGTTMERIGSEERTEHEAKEEMGSRGYEMKGKCRAYFMFLTLIVFHPETSPLNDEAP